MPQKLNSEIVKMSDEPNIPSLDIRVGYVLDIVAENSGEHGRSELINQTRFWQDLTNPLNVQ